VAETAL